MVPLSALLLMLAAAPLASTAGEGLERRLHAAAEAGDTAALGPILASRTPAASSGVFHLLESTDSQGMTALMLAAREGRTPFIEMLLATGARADALCVHEGRSARHKTALFWAVSRGHAGSTRALIAGGAAVGLKNRDGETALVVAVTRDGASPDTAAVEIELVHGQVAVDVVDAKGRTPLMLAAKLGRSRVVQVLLHAGADPNRLASGGESALMFAAAKGHADIVRELLLGGADIALKRHGHGEFQARIGAETARGFAAVNHRTEVERILADAEKQQTGSQEVPPADQNPDLRRVERSIPVSMKLAKGELLNITMSGVGGVYFVESGDGSVLATAVFPAIPAAADGLASGWRVVAVDGVRLKASAKPGTGAALRVLLTTLDEGSGNKTLTLEQPRPIVSIGEKGRDRVRKRGNKAAAKLAQATQSSAGVDVTADFYEAAAELSTMMNALKLAMASDGTDDSSSTIDLRRPFTVHSDQLPGWLRCGAERCVTPVLSHVLALATPGLGTLGGRSSDDPTIAAWQDDAVAVAMWLAYRVPNPDEPSAEGKTTPTTT